MRRLDQTQHGRIKSAWIFLPQRLRPALAAQQLPRRQRVDGGIKGQLKGLRQRARAQRRGQAVGGFNAGLPATEFHPGAPGRLQVLGKGQQQHRIAWLQPARLQPVGRLLGKPVPEEAVGMGGVQRESDVRGLGLGLGQALCLGLRLSVHRLLVGSMRRGRNTPGAS